MNSALNSNIDSVLTVGRPTNTMSKAKTIQTGVAFQCPDKYPLYGVIFKSLALGG
jgi:hypothetical protein